jgi:hypothetical protein
MAAILRSSPGNRFILMALLAMAVGCRGACMSEKAKMEMLTAVPEKPRYIAFILRSYAGSRQHLLVAANELLDASPVGGDPKKRGAGGLRVMEAKGNLREHYLGALRYKTNVSIQQALDIAREIEKKLEDPRKSGARETVRIDLAWVQGVTLTVPGKVTLPSPELDSDGAVAWMFEDAIRHVVLEVFGSRDEAQAFLKKSGKIPEIQETKRWVLFTMMESLAMYRKVGHREWKASGTNLAEALAGVGCAVATAPIEAKRTRDEGETALDPKLAKLVEEQNSDLWSHETLMENSYGVERGWDALNERRKIRFVESVELEVAVPPAIKEDRLMLRWASEVQALAREKRLRVGLVAVVTQEPGRIRGVLFGERSEKTVPGVEILGARFREHPEEWDIRYEGRLSTGNLVDDEARHP